MKKLLLVLLSLSTINAYADSVKENCTDSVVPWEGRAFKMDVFTSPQILITNDTNEPQTVHLVAKTFDMSTGEFGTFTKDETIQPHRQWGASPPVKLFMKINGKGEHIFKGVADVTGYKTFHSEVQCHVLAKKYEYGDFVNGLKQNTSE